MQFDISQIKFDANGLVPAIVQDCATKEVVMLAYMNKESLLKTMETGYTWFWSRSRKELWNKGATSGNLQEVREMIYDCDGDTILIKAALHGPACHTGEYSCFFNSFWRWR
nr:phosphoribosyl-AMP cyclohydrolase [uncultured Phascolarctobacterium sp.]